MVFIYNMNIFNKGAFIKDYLKIDSALIRTLSLFNGTYSNISDFQLLSIDTLKVLAEDNYHIQLKAQALFPEENAIPIYFYNSDYDESTNSINEVVNQNNDILIWPIPASDYMNISFKKFETTIKQLSIFDIYGNLVQQESSPENNRYISIQDLETGIYFLSIETSKNHYSIKIIKH